MRKLSWFLLICLLCACASMPGQAADAPKVTMLLSGDNVPPPGNDVLLELRHSDGGLRMQDLSERVVLSRTRVSRLVEEMVRAGLVRRRPDPDDGRVSWAVITETGRSALRATAPVYLDSIRTHFVARLEADAAEVRRRALMRGAGRPPDEPLPGAAPRGAPGTARRRCGRGRCWGGRWTACPAARRCWW